ncbi:MULTISPECIES: DUF1002 domain-containing protein [unclassified Bacillus (in: firmicutes)]|uniref:DUF1002 domain-containing protein n=1 Tax=unclassified Bacillus (in: firmicutes) TaxID=185979 RepID=UPI0008EEF0D5|nr:MULTISPECIES: DUF1002 domain-containing protein [unclassified Bacillus (in: firmicutes)]SFA77721.1 Uncharacterized protein YpuA, DUF1002 family [Bacillus sp. UNCCL13]SFQ67643.1 Uncharacterized protein YpuA, DUF1002 family [Bacillus sp. cl95]
MITKGFLKMVTIGAVFTFAISLGNIAHADESINEKYGLPIVVYGEALIPAQKEEVRDLLKVEDVTKVKEITVNGDDLVTYIKGDKHSNMYSSAKITRKDTGEGLVINQVTPKNITEVTDEMYANALLTAGIQDAVVDVASPVKVSGHSALVGIYKAYDEGKGTELDKERTEVANEELNLATDLAKKEGMDQDKVSELLTEIKKEIAEQNPATKEEVEKIIDDKLKALGLELSAADRQLLVDLFEKMRGLNINFDNVQSQLEDLSKDIQQRIEEAVGENKGFIESVSNFFKELIDAIKGIFS